MEIQTSRPLVDTFADHESTLEWFFFKMDCIKIARNIPSVDIHMEANMAREPLNRGLIPQLRRSFLTSKSPWSEELTYAEANHD
jgi:hypothetical protein